MKLNTVKEIFHTKQISKAKCVTVHRKCTIIIMFQKMMKDDLVINLESNLIKNKRKLSYIEKYRD